MRWRYYIRIVHVWDARIVMKQTKISSSEFGWLRRDREFLAVALVFGISLTALENIKATDAPARPVKDLSQANDQLNWPQDLTPSIGDSFVHNEIWINTSACVIWQNLIDAKDWPKWYSNAADVQISLRFMPDQGPGQPVNRRRTGDSKKVSLNRRMILEM
jgi:hypothetical protein